MIQLTVNISPELYDELLIIMNKYDIPISELIKNSLALELWVIQQKENGNEFLIKEHDEISEIIMPVW